MSEIFTQKQLKKRFANKMWIFGYNELISIYDEKNNIIELVEDYAPYNGLFAEAWRTLHFPNTSPIVVVAKREGTKSIFRIKPGKAELKLKPAIAPIGIEEAVVEKNEIKITYAGFGGGGVSACYCRGLAKGVKRIEILQHAGGDKLGKATLFLPKLEKTIISVDDTDNEEEGATYALVHNIAMRLNSKDLRYYTHVNAQLFPENPHKTRNCMSTSVSFVHKPGMREKIEKTFVQELKKYSLSDNTGMVSFSGILLPDAVKEYALRAKRTFLVSVKEAIELARKNRLNVFEVTGPRGIIGALAGIGMHDNPEFAASLPDAYGF